MGRHKEILIRRPTIKTGSLEEREERVFCLRASKALPSPPTIRYGARKATRGLLSLCRCSTKISSKVSEEMEIESRWEYFLFPTSSQKANHYFVNDDSRKENCAFRILNGRKRQGRVTRFSARMKTTSTDCLSDAQTKALRFTA